MAYQLRSRKDLATTDSQEQTDIPVSNLTEQQVTTQSQTLFVPPQLSETQSAALPTSEANHSIHFEHILKTGNGKHYSVGHTRTN